MPLDNTTITTAAITNAGDRHQTMNGSNVLLKRRASETYVQQAKLFAFTFRTRKKIQNFSNWYHFFKSVLIPYSVYDHQSSIHEWADYMLQSKRPHLIMGAAGNSHLFPSHPPLFEYPAAPSHVEPFPLDKVCSLHLQHSFNAQLEQFTRMREKYGSNFHSLLFYFPKNRPAIAMNETYGIIIPVPQIIIIWMGIIGLQVNRCHHRRPPHWLVSAIAAKKNGRIFIPC